MGRAEQFPDDAGVREGVLLEARVAAGAGLELRGGDGGPRLQHRGRPLRRRLDLVHEEDRGGAAEGGEVGCRAAEPLGAPGPRAHGADAAAGREHRPRPADRRGPEALLPAQLQAALLPRRVPLHLQPAERHPRELPDHRGDGLHEDRGPRERPGVRSPRLHRPLHGLRDLPQHLHGRRRGGGRSGPTGSRRAGSRTSTS